MLIEGQKRLSNGKAADIAAMYAMRLDFKHIGNSYYLFENQCNQSDTQGWEVRIDVIRCPRGPNVAFLEWKHWMALSHLVHGMK